MNLLIGLLTILLVINSLLLLLLVLIQLPKKEAGIGVAFGGSATDALFGAGTGTVLTKATRYGTTTFLLLCIALSILYARSVRSSRESIVKELETGGAAPAAAVAAPVPPVTATNIPAAAPVQPAAPAAQTNAAAAPATPPATNAPAAAKPSAAPAAKPAAATNQAASASSSK